MTDMIKGRERLLCCTPLRFFSLYGDIQKREHNRRTGNTEDHKGALSVRLNEDSVNLKGDSF